MVPVLKIINYKKKCLDFSGFLSEREKEREAKTNFGSEKS
jgi:hypothetical protein